MRLSEDSRGLFLELRGAEIDLALEIFEASDNHAKGTVKDTKWPAKKKAEDEIRVLRQPALTGVAWVVAKARGAEFEISDPAMSLVHELAPQLTRAGVVVAYEPPVKR